MTENPSQLSLEMKNSLPQQERPSLTLSNTSSEAVMLWVQKRQSPVLQHRARHFNGEFKMHTHLFSSWEIMPQTVLGAVEIFSRIFWTFSTGFSQNTWTGFLMYVNAILKHVNVLYEKPFSNTWTQFLISWTTLFIAINNQKVPNQ